MPTRMSAISPVPLFVLTSAVRERASAYEYQAVPVTYSVNSNGNETARGADTVTYDQANRLTSVGLAGVQTPVHL